MDTILHLHPTPERWLFDSSLEPYIVTYADHLILGDYAPKTIHTYMLCLAHLARWMSQSRCEVADLDESAISCFLNEHLPDCDCPKPVCRNRHNLSAACGHLLRVLRDNAIIAEPTVKIGPVDEELHGFDEYMNRVRGLAGGTRHGRIAIVRRLLIEFFTGRPLLISTLQPADVRKFLAKELNRCGTVSHASTLASALRAYFRYRTT